MKSILKEPVQYYEIKQNINEPEFSNLAPKFLISG